MAWSVVHGWGGSLILVCLCARVLLCLDVIAGTCLREVNSQLGFRVSGLRTYVGGITVVQTKSRCTGHHWTIWEV